MVKQHKAEKQSVKNKRMASISVLLLVVCVLILSLILLGNYLSSKSLSKRYDL